MRSFLSNLNLYNQPTATVQDESNQLYQQELNLWKSVDFSFDEAVSGYNTIYFHSNISHTAWSSFARRSEQKAKIVGCRSVREISRNE